jgi:ribonuclease HI
LKPKLNFIIRFGIKVIMHKKVLIFTDGGSRSNPGPAAIGVLILDEKSKFLAEAGEYVGIATNNEAEYLAVIRGLGLASKFTKEEVSLTCDSQLVASQLSGKYKIKEPRLRELAKKAREMEKAFRKVTYIHVKRDNPFIKRADKIVNETLDEVGK